MAMGVGGLILLIGAVAGFWIGRASGDPGGLQARATVREMLQERSQRKRQIAAARDALSRIIVDPRTHPHTKLELEERVVALLTERARTA